MAISRDMFYGLESEAIQHEGETMTKMSVVFELYVYGTDKDGNEVEDNGEFLQMEHALPFVPANGTLFEWKTDRCERTYRATSAVWSIQRNLFVVNLGERGAEGLCPDGLQEYLDEGWTIKKTNP